MKQIAAIGEAMLELSHQSDASLALSFAGDTLNFAIYLRRLLPTKSFNIHYVTAVGDDIYSSSMLTHWQQEGLNTDMVYRLKNKLPGLYLIHTNAVGERTFYFYRENSAAREFFNTFNTESAIDLLSQRLLTMDYLYLSGIVLAILNPQSREYLWKLLEQSKKKGVQIIFDTNYRASLWSNAELARQTIERTLPWVDIAFPTLLDEQALFGDMNAAACAQRLLEKGITEVIIKCGAAPAFIATISQQMSVPAHVVEKVVDTTGAGDSFNAAYMAARLLGREPEEAAQWGHSLAATVITHPGAIIPAAMMPHLF